MKISVKQKLALLNLMLVASICSIIYEFSISTTLSYLVGSTITNFSLTIGWFMFSIGIGSYFTKYIHKNYLQTLLKTQIFNSFLGGISASLIHIIHVSSGFTYFFSGIILFLIGFCIGFEIPMVVRIFELSENKLKDSLANILTIDYIGALFASVIFPFILLPLLGVQLTTVVLGILNLLVITFVVISFKKQLNLKTFFPQLITVFLILCSILIFNKPLNTIYKKALLGGDLVYEQNTPYQNITISKYKDDYALFLDNKLQFHTKDEARYHESLVHIPISFTNSPKDILILGGGDGLAARELLTYPFIGSIKILDLDSDMTDLATNHPILTKINQGSLSSPKVEIINHDAFVFDSIINQEFDLIIADLVDPGDLSTGRLYTKEFYSKIKSTLSPNGLFVTQASSPLYARKSFWSIHQSLSEVFINTKPYTINIPSFGEWGFVIASDYELSMGKLSLQNLNYLNDSIVESSFRFSEDTKYIDVESSTLQDQNTVHYYWDELKNI